MKRYKLIETKTNQSNTTIKIKSISEGFFDWLINTTNYQTPVIEIDWDRVTDEFVELDVDQMDRCEKKVKAYLYSLLVNDFTKRKKNAQVKKNIGELAMSKKYQHLIKEGGFDWIFGGPNTYYDTPVVTINWEVIENNMYKFPATSKKMYEKMVISYFLKILEQFIQM